MNNVQSFNPALDPTLFNFKVEVTTAKVRARRNEGKLRIVDEGEYSEIPAEFEKYFKLIIINDNLEVSRDDLRSPLDIILVTVNYKNKILGYVVVDNPNFPFAVSKDYIETQVKDSYEYFDDVSFNYVVKCIDYQLKYLQEIHRQILSYSVSLYKGDLKFIVTGDNINTSFVVPNARDALESLIPQLNFHRNQFKIAEGENENE